jgi:hypothetical protein
MITNIDEKNLPPVGLDNGDRVGFSVIEEVA